MKKRFFVVLSVWFLVISSCRPTFNSVIGVYKYKDALGLADSELMLNRDSTFSYRFNGGDIYKVNTDGIWTLTSDRKHIVFTSRLKSEQDLISVVEKRNSEIKEGGKRVRVYDSQNSLFPAYIKVNPSDSIIFSESDFINGVGYFETDLINQVAIRYIGLTTNVILYNVVDSNANDIIIHIKKTSGLKYRFFNNEKWKIKNKKLLDPTLNKYGNNTFYKYE